MFRLQRGTQLVLVLTLGGLALRVVFLDAQPLWWDEGYSIFFATESLSRLLELTSFDIHPPLNYVLLKYWFALFGVTPVRARLLSVVLGVVAIPVMWLVSKELWPRRRVAILATSLLVVSPFHVYYSQEVRMYALLLVLTLLSVLGFLRASRTGESRWWAVTVAGLVGALLTQYYAAFVVATVVITWLWLRREQPAALPHLPSPRTAGLLLGATVVIYLPWALYAGWRLYNYVSAKVVIEGDAPMSPLQFPWRHAVVFSVGHLMPEQAWLAAATLIFVALAVVGAWYGWQQSRWQTGVTFIWLCTPLVGGFAINLVAPFTDPRIERQMIPALPAFLLLIALGLETVAQRASVRASSPERAWNAIGFSILLLTFSLVSLLGFYTIPRYPEDDYRPILSYVGARQGPDDVWLAVYPWQVGYLRAYLPADRRPAEFFLPQDRLETWSSDADVRDAGLERLFERYQRIWFPAFQIQGRILESRLSESLQSEGVPVWNEWFGNTRLWLAARNDVDATAAPMATFTGDVRLTTVERSTDAEPSGIGVVPILLEWDRTDGKDLRVSLQIVGAGEHTWGEYDGAVEGPGTRAGLLVDPGTPPGEYSLRLRLYDAGAGRLHDLLDENGNPLAPELILGAVQVTRPPVQMPASAVSAARAFDLPVGDNIRFIGATIGTDRVKTGDTVPVTLFWQAHDDVEDDYKVFVQALDSNGAIQGARDVAPVEGWFPTERWKAGDLVRDPHHVPIGAGAPAGRYTLIAGLYNPDTGERLPTQRGADHVPIGTVIVEERPHVFEAPAFQQAVGVQFGDVATLVGATIDWPDSPDRLRPGSTLPVQLIWQPQRTPPADLRAFVQLLNANDTVDGVSDHRPGDAPTRAWVAGEYIVDEHTLVVDDDAAGSYHLVVGLYNPDAGRLTTPDGTDTVVLTTIDVR